MSDEQLRQFIRERIHGEAPPSAPTYAGSAGHGTGDLRGLAASRPTTRDPHEIDDLADASEPDPDESADAASPRDGADGSDVGPVFPPLHPGREMVDEVLASDPEEFEAEHGMSPEEYVHWMTTASPAEWRTAAEEAGWSSEEADRERPGYTELPVELQVERHRSNLAQLAADIKAGRKPPL